MGTFPKTRWRDLAGLAARILTALIVRGDKGEAVAGWLRSLTVRYRSPDIVINLFGRNILFSSSSALSKHILSAPPSEGNFVAGTVKRKAMSFLAPNALTILHGEDWRVLRAYNEEILQPGEAHAQLPTISANVEKAFSRPVANVEELRLRMGQVMLATVFGEGIAPESLISDIQELFAEVGLRTALFGSRKGAKLQQFRSEVRQLWNSGARSANSSFIATAHQSATGLAPEYRREEYLLDQIPNWMFTFTNSGSDLLARSLSIIRARPASLARVRQEIDAAKHSSHQKKHGDLQYLEACIRETGRLFPPVIQTAHRAARGHVFGEMEIEEGMEILQYFPFINRDESLDPLANYFRPERWLDPDDPIHTREVNDFLSGPRACPGRNIILFVVKSAIIRLLSDEGIEPKPSPLSKDPLPFSFTKRFLQF